MITYQNCLIDITSESGFFYFDIYSHTGDHIYGYDNETIDYDTYGDAYAMAMDTIEWITDIAHS